MQIRLLSMLALMLMALPFGCARFDSQANWIKGSAEVQIDELLPPAQARREAIQWAEVRARDQVLAQVSEMQVGGESVKVQAIRNPGLLGLLRDVVRAAPITARDVDMDKGIAAVTVALDPQMVEQAVNEFSAL